MAKLGDIEVYRASGGVTFHRKFPCYVGTDGVFSAIVPDDLTAAMRSFLKDRSDVKQTLDRQKRLRVTSRDKLTLELTLNIFADNMMSGESETRLFIYFKANVKGTFCKTQNGHIYPLDFNADTSLRRDLEGSHHTLKKQAVWIGPDVALVNVTQVKTRTGSVSYTTKLVNPVEVEDDKLKYALASWSAAYIGPDDWWRIKDNVKPYAPVTAAYVCDLLVRIATMGDEVATFRDVDVGDLF